jgi:hypothetical protein
MVWRSIVEKVIRDRKGERIFKRCREKRNCDFLVRGRWEN